MQAAQFLDSETILKHLPFLSPDEIDGILERKQAEEMERIEQAMTMQGMESGAMGEMGAEDEEMSEGDSDTSEEILSMLDDLLTELGEEEE